MRVVDPIGRRSGHHPKGPRWFVAGGILIGVLVGGAAWLLAPHVTTTVGGPGLLQMQVRGWHDRIVEAEWTEGSQTVSLARRGQGLWPVKALAPGGAGRVTVAVRGPGWLDWLPWERVDLSIPVSVPALPELRTVNAHYALNGRVSLNWTAPIERLWINGRKFSVHGRDVTVRLAPPHPGEKGHWTIRAEGPLWEKPVPPVKVAWSTPAYLSITTNPATPLQGLQPLTVRLSQPITVAHLSRWRLNPAVAGTWKRISPTVFAFQPQKPWAPDLSWQLNVPGSLRGPVSQSGSFLAHAVRLQGRTRPGSVLRLQELLAEEGYLPVRWVSAGRPLMTEGQQQSAIYEPPAGTFQWKFTGLPAALRALWQPGQWTPMVAGAVMQFERANGLAVDGVAGPEVWHALIQDRLNGVTSPYPYTYIYVTETLPETLQLWVNGQVQLTTRANTGIPATPTLLGTYPVYERLPFQIMRGVNPNGTPYADPVSWINYFVGGDAVHGFVRAQYGFPQSLGCVEVPPAVAATIYHTIHYGTLVTVEPPGVSPPAS